MILVEVGETRSGLNRTLEIISCVRREIEKNVEFIS